MWCGHRRWPWGIGLIVLLIGAFYALPLLLWRGLPYGYYGPRGMMGGYPFWMGGGIWMMIFWVILIGLGLYWLFSLIPDRNVTRSRHDILDILKERYARGEITREQYEEMKRDLTE
ncbi:MAG: SHOCT domain-containing protein [Firmicutes bacterium]|nr:SHOCT domain-containing protein [Bacillota bacterium]MCL5039310.1 SHOCT domain-containing protein [Bacillota bacterium]